MLRLTESEYRALVAAKKGGKPARKGRCDKHSDSLAFQCQQAGLGTAQRNFRFALEIGRRLEFDLAWVERKFSVEVDGRAHCIFSNQQRDVEKSQIARSLGWDLLRVTTKQVRSGEALELIRRILAT